MLSSEEASIEREEDETDRIGMTLGLAQKISKLLEQYIDSLKLSKLIKKHSRH